MCNNNNNNNQEGVYRDLLRFTLEGVSIIVLSYSTKKSHHIDIKYTMSIIYPIT